LKSLQLELNKLSPNPNAADNNQKLSLEEFVDRFKHGCDLFNRN